MDKLYRRLQVSEDGFYLRISLKDGRELDIWIAGQESSWKTFYRIYPDDTYYIEMLIEQDLELLLSRAMVTTNPQAKYLHTGASELRYCITIVNPSWRRKYS